MILKDKKAVIFDLDGTLVDSMWMWRSIDIDFLEGRGIPFPEDLQSKIEGMSFVETAEYFKRSFRLPDSVTELMDIWNEMAMDKYRFEVKLKPGVMKFLNYLKERKIKMGIATSNSRELLNGAMEQHHLDEYMDCMVTANEIKHGKPAPDVYLKAAEHLQVKPEQCLVFEDIVPGIVAGKRAGMEVCAVWDAYSVEQDVQKRTESDYYIKSYEDLLNESYGVNE